MLELKEEEQTFTFEDVASEPIPSLLRYKLARSRKISIFLSHVEEFSLTSVGAAAVRRCHVICRDMDGGKAVGWVWRTF